MTAAETLAARAEAVLFASGEPVPLTRLCGALDSAKSDIKEAVACLEEKYSDETSAVELLRLGDSFQLAVKKRFADDVKAALEIKKEAALSPAAMEVLTIAAYNQPVTKGFVESVRGVDSSGVVNSLVEKELLCESGRLDIPGRPIAYKTTDNFLRAFGLRTLDELPPLPVKDGAPEEDEASGE